MIALSESGAGARSAETERCNPPTEPPLMPSMGLQMQPEMTIEQKVNLLFNFCEVFERDQEILLYGMQALLRGKAESERFDQYVADRSEAVSRIRAAAGMVSLSDDEKTDPGMNG